MTESFQKIHARQTDENIESYTGMKTNASHRSYLEIEPNRSVRPSYTRSDYDAFRPEEALFKDAKRSIQACMNAYRHVGIIHNVIDLMGDFASQGIIICHEDKKIQRFYRKWWKTVKGDEVSERFLNILYRIGNVVVKREYARVGRRNQKEMTKGEDSLIEKIRVRKLRVPYKFTFLNPLSFDVKGGVAAAFVGEIALQQTISPEVITELKKPANKFLYDKLPPRVKEAIDNNTNKFDLDMENIDLYYYKKDNWQIWAEPMIQSILDDIASFEKNKLADLSALDGIISNIRLWTLGSLEHKILPNPAAINKLRDIIASNVGGGVMDLIWGDDLKFTESNTQAYHFLGEEKYKPVLNSIYAGLGIPQSLTGNIGGASYTNNFVSLKVLIDRLEYGRSLLNRFWEKQIELVQKSMGFDKPAKLHYSTMISSDENAEKNLFKELASMNIISLETVRERFGENNDIESSRVKNEMKARKDKQIPVQSDPYHNANYEGEFIKTALNTGELSIKDIIEDISPSNPGLKKDKMLNDMKKNAPDKNGRPKFAKDTKPRKQRTVLPKTKSFASYILWADESQKKIADILNEPLLKFYGKKNLRELSTQESVEVEDIKFNVLTKLSPLSTVNHEKILPVLKTLTPLDKGVLAQFNRLSEEFFLQRGRLPTLDETKRLNSFSFILDFLSKNDENQPIRCIH